MPVLIQPAFSRGELSPSLYGRVDTAVYNVGLRKARNVVVHPYGGLSNRPGLMFIGPVKDHTAKPRLIKFQFNTTDTYYLEFGNLYMRVIRNDGHVLEAAKTISGATQANPVVITATSHGYSNGDEVFIDEIVGMTELNGRRFKVANKTTHTFELTDQLTGDNIDGTGYTAYSSAGESSKVYEITTPYATADLFDIKFTQSADVMTLVHPSYEPRELTRTGHSSWTMSVIDFDPDQDHPTGLTATQNGTTGSTEYRYQVTAIADDTLEESLPALNTTSKTITGATAADPVVITATGHGFLDGEQVEINGIVGMTELNGRRFTVDNKNANDFELKGEDGSGHTAYASGGTANLTFMKVTNGNATLSATNNIEVSWTEVTGAQRYAVYRYDNGLYGLIGETEEVNYTDDGGDAPDLDSAPPAQRLPFIGTDNYPGAVNYYEQRLVFGGTNNKPDTSFYSQAGAFSNMNVSTPSKADDAMTVTLTSQEVNRIRHFVLLSDLIILTSGEEWRVNAGDNSGFSVETLRQKPQSRWGAGHQRPITIGNTVLFVQDTNKIVRSIGYSLEIDGYTGSNMTLLANHLFRFHGIDEWAYASSPDPLVVAIKDDGMAAALTFDQEQGVLAWTTWDTPNGKFESVAAGRPTITDTYGAHFFVVKRTINGTTARYIERTHDRDFEDVRDCFFVDSGLSLDNPVTITGATAADPVVITAASHGFSNGDLVDIHDIEWVPDTDTYDTETQPDQLNGGRYKVANKTTHTFELTDAVTDANIDGSAFNAYVEGGTARLAVTTVGGLHHLEGQSVVALANGNVVKNLTVADGEITLSLAASRVHVGLKMIADVETLDMEFATASDPTLQGKLKHVPKATIRFERSRGLWIGPAFDDMTEMKQREFEDYGEPTNLLTGDKEIILPPDWNTNGRIALRQRDPLPMTILAIIPHVVFETEDRGDE